MDLEIYLRQKSVFRLLDKEVKSSVKPGILEGVNDNRSDPRISIRRYTICPIWINDGWWISYPNV